MMKCLVTGGTGFAGSTLVERLVEDGHPVAVLSRTGKAGHLEAVAGVEIVACDLTDQASVERELGRLLPEAIFHLAARTFVPDAFADRLGFLEANLLGTAHLLKAARDRVPGCRVLVVSSAGVYGRSGQAGRPLTEEAPLLPMDPYAASKAAAELWAVQEESSSGLQVVCVRPFGHVGPRQPPRFVVADFARQIGRIRCGEQPPRIEVGNLQAVREFNSVEDIASGHLAALHKGQPGRVYNLCSGLGLSIGDMLQLLLERSGVQAEIRPRPDRLRPADVPYLVGDPSRARQELGWEVKRPVTAALDSVLERWGGARK